MKTEDIDPLLGRAPLPLEGVYTDSNGYFRRRSDKKLVHRMTYYTAHPNTDQRWQIHHINGEKKDNRLENLIALRPGVHKRLHDTFSMKNLPSREEILKWIESGRKPRKEKKKKRPAASYKPRLFFQRGGKPYFPRVPMDKPFKPKVIIRKGGEKDVKTVPELKISESYKNQLLQCFRGKRRKRRKRKNHMTKLILPQTEPVQDPEFIQARWQLWEKQ